MAVTITTEPTYTIMKPIWDELHITGELGEKGVKKWGTTFLPKTEGQEEDDVDGEKRYTKYKQRATFYDFVGKTIKEAMGLIHSKPAIVQIANEKVSPWLDKITIDGEDIQSLIRDVNYAQLLYGRIGLLLDYPEDGNTDFPHVVKYSADSILCWEEITVDGKKKPRFILLDESGMEFDYQTKQYTEKEQYRLLALANVQSSKSYYYTVVLTAGEWASWDIDNPDTEKITIPKVPKTINYIPFVCVNIKTSTMKIEKPLLMELSNLSLSAYRVDADYKQALYIQAFALLYMTGVEEAKVKKQGVRSDGFFATGNKDAKVGYASASADGLAEMRMALTELKAEARNNSIVISDKEGVESGKALETRIALRTSDLREISLTCAEAIKRIITWGCEWMKAPKAKITLTPNLNYKQERSNTQDYQYIWNVVSAGGMSLKNLYRWALQNDYATEATYDEWEGNLKESLTVLGFSFGGSGANLSQANVKAQDDAMDSPEEDARDNSQSKVNKKKQLT